MAEALRRRAGHGDADRRRPACCSALAAASITTPLPVPAGPISTATRSGPVIISSAWRCSSLSGRRSAPRRRLASVRARSPTTRRRASRACDVAFDRQLSRTHARGSSCVRPPAGSRVGCRSSARRLTSACSGASSPADCSSARRAALPVNTARSSVRLDRSTRSASSSAAATTIRCNASLAREAVSCGRLTPRPVKIAAGRRVLGLAVLELEMAQLAGRGRPSRVRAEPLRRRATSRLRAENASITPAGTPATSK